MIRANNHAAVTALIQQLYPPLHKILIVEYTSLALIALLVFTYFILAMAVPLRIYHLIWIMGEVVIGCIYKKILNDFKVESTNEYLHDKGWLRDSKEKVVAFRYIKFVCLLFDILGLMQLKQFISVQSISYFCICLAYIPLCMLVLLKTKEAQVLLQKINRVMSNFDIDFEQEKSQYLNQMSNQEQKLLTK